MVEPRCPVCGDDLASRTHGGAPFRECLHCGFALLADDPEQPDYWTSRHDDGSDDHYWTTAKNRYFNAALDALARLAPGRRLLDVGGGVGFFSEVAVGRGWDAYSLDVSGQATRLAAARIGDERALGDIAVLEPASFDVACLWCVVAHTRDPQALVDSVARVVAPGGVIWISTPNFAFQKPYARIRSKIGRPIDFAREDHVGHFTFSALSTLLRSHGFDHVRQHLVGVTETCLVAGSDSRVLVGAKKVFNRAAFAFAQLGARNFVSELQVSARRC